MALVKQSKTPAHIANAYILDKIYLNLSIIDIIVYSAFTDQCYQSKQKSLIPQVS